MFSLAFRQGSEAGCECQHATEETEKLIFVISKLMRICTELIGTGIGIDFCFILVGWMFVFCSYFFP